MKVVAYLVPVILVCACGSHERVDQARRRRIEKGRRLIATLDRPGELDRVVALGAAEPLIEATQKGRPERVRRLACLGLGEVGGARAAARLVELLGAVTRKPEIDGPIHLYAAAGLNRLLDPGTAVDLILQLSRVNPNDSLAARAAEGQTGPYYTIDATICDALLGLGLWDVEEDLVEQLERHDYVRTLIDAAAVLRRRTGLRLPFHYNASYADRAKEAEAWRRALRATREKRFASRPFAAADPRFRARCAEMMVWLKGRSVNHRFIARAVVRRLGRYAVPFLLAELASADRVAERQAALLLGEIGYPGTAAGLRKAIILKDADARAEVVRALRKLGDRKSSGAVRALLHDRDAEVRAEAGRFLGRLGGAKDRAALKAALAAERAPGTRAAFLCALLRIGERGEVPAELVRVFLDGEQPDREAALAAFEEIGGKVGGASALASRAERGKVAAVFLERLRGR